MAKKPTYEELEQRVKELEKEACKREQAEDALRESEQRFKELAELLPVSVFELDVDGNFTYSNRCGFEMFGYTREDFAKGMNALQMFIPEERLRVKQNILKRLTGEEFEDHEYTALKKDGSTLTILISTAAIIRDNKSVGVRGLVMDITERKRAEAALKKSEEEKASILDATSDLITYNDPELKILWANRAAGESVGLSPEELVGRFCYDIWMQSSEPCPGCPVVEALNTGQTKESEVITQDGAIWSHKGYPVLDEKGEALGVVVSTADITERKRAKEALEHEKWEKETILESLIEHVVYQNIEHKILWANQAACESVGMTHDELLGRYCYEIWPKLDRPCEDCPVNTAMTTGLPCEIEKGTPDGRFWFIRGYPVRDTSGNIVGGIEITQEITERKRAEKELQESEERFRAIAASAQDAIIMMDNEGNVSYWNDAAERTFGYSSDEIIGKELHTILGPKRFHEAYQRAFPEFQVSGKGNAVGKILELAAVRKDGTEFPIELSVSSVYLKGKWSAIGILRDISERKRFEAQLQHAQKMVSIGTLTSGVAHNFRNILSPISLYSQLIQTIYKDDLKLKEMAEKTEQCVKRGTQLVNGLMQFSRKHTKDLETLNVAEVLRETYDLITKSFDKKIDIRMDIADSLPIRGDHSGLSQVFMNLCTNARDAMPDGGELLIEAGVEGGDALITISDTGFGMDEQTREQCFDPFFTTKETDKGTGLGLSTAYGIVKDLGGEIHVFSELNKGTTFKLYFPLALLDEYQRQAGIYDIVQGSGEKVLIIDDEVDILEALVLLAEQLCYRAASADSGKAGIDKYKSWRPDVVLLDRNMPVMDGLKCAQSILEYDPEARIVLISGYDAGGPSGIDKKTKALIKSYLTKPINIEEISQAIRKVLDKDC